MGLQTSRGQPDIPQVGARLLFKKAWSKAPRWIRRTISRGASWHWMQDPPPTKIPVFRTQKHELDLLVARFLSEGAIEKVEVQPCVLSPIFAVPKSSGDLRLILNLTSLNLQIKKVPFKMHIHVTLRKILPKGAYMASLDIKDAYLHVPIAKSFQKYLAFSHGQDLFFFKALPFGLCVAPYIFTRVLEFPLRQLREEGVRVLAYLDDLILWGPTRLDLLTDLEKVLTSLQKFGLIINREKSMLQPVQDIVWLGVRWESRFHTCGPSMEIIDRIVDRAKSLMNQTLTSRRSLESFMGLIAFAAQLLPQAKSKSHYIAKLMSKLEEPTRDKQFPVPATWRVYLPWWTMRKNLTSQAPLLPQPPSLRAWTDASDTG